MELSTEAAPQGTAIPFQPLRPLDAPPPSTSEAASDPLSGVTSVVCGRPCRHKTCKKIVKPYGEGAVQCEQESCSHYIHRACSTQLLESFGADGAFDSIVCHGKRCYNSIVKSSREVQVDTAVKKRVMWHNDGCIPSISSLSCLIDWLTSGDDYNRYRGGPGQTGETKMAIANEVVRVIEESGVPTARAAKDVMTKIGAIESSFKKAADWLANTGQGVTDEASLTAAILSRCAYYYELYDVMQDRPSTKAIMLNTDPLMQVSDLGSGESSGGDDGALGQSDGSDHESGDDIDCNKASKAVSKRPRSTPLNVTGPFKKPKYDTASIEPSFVELKEAQLKHEREVSQKNLAYRQQEIDLRREEIVFLSKKSLIEEREAAARVEEAAARAAKLRHEANHWKLQVKVTLLRERKQLQDDGVPQDLIDKLLPLTTQFQ